MGYHKFMVQQTGFSVVLDTLFVYDYLSLSNTFRLAVSFSSKDNLIIMYRHLSPKTGPKQKPDQPHPKPKPIPFNGQPSSSHKQLPNQHEPKLNSPKQKDIKNLNTFLTNNPIPPHSGVKVINYPHTQNAPNFANSSDNLKPPRKNGSAFDDYYQRNSKHEPIKRKNEDVSNSGDSYQSQGYKALKKPFATKSNADKGPEKHKNLVVAPLITNQELRNGFKSPGNKPQNRANLEEDSGKRVGSFGGKKAAGISKFLEDNNCTNKKQHENSDYKISFKPQMAAKPTQNLPSFPGLNLSNQQNKPQHKLDDQKSVKQKSNKNVPKFVLNGNIKSSPYLNKYALDSSNQQSVGDKPEKGKEKAKVVPLLQQLKREKDKEDKKKHKEEDKSLSFNKGEMFSNLKKRQEMHSILTKEINMLGVNLELKLITSEGHKSITFLLVKKISESKTTAIFLASHTPTNSLYCLKRISLIQAKSSTLQQTIRQHKIHQMCTHPHIVKYFFSGFDTHHLYLGMQYMQSETLGHELKQQILKNMSEQGTTKAKINETVTSQISKVNKIRKILYQLITAINYLHQKSIIHRDIKPDNIFVSHQTYKLGDLGSAGLQGSLQYVGTLDYAAPQILTQSTYNSKIDIWSLGCIAYELDVGRPPFFHISQQQTKKLAISGDYDKTLICDSQLRKLIDQMLVVNTRSRLSAKQLLKHEFFQRLDEESNIF